MEDIAKQEAGRELWPRAKQISITISHFPFSICAISAISATAAFVFEPKVVCGGRWESSRSRAGRREKGGGGGAHKLLRSALRRFEALRRHRHHICPGRGSGSI